MNKLTQILIKQRVIILAQLVKRQKTHQFVPVGFSSIHFLPKDCFVFEMAIERVPTNGRIPTSI